MSVPKRDDQKYIEIENFKDYELTNCIAYEMVIRNDEFIETKEKLYKTYKKNYEQWVIEIEEAEEKFGLMPINESSFIMSRNRHKLKKGLLESRVRATNKKNRENFTLDKNLNLNKVVFGVENINDIWHESFSHIVTARPLLKFSSMKHTHIKLNMNLPLAELTAYIKEIKEQFHKDNTKVKIASEIFGVPSDEKLINKKYPKKTKAEKMADWFFIYDSYKLLDKNINKTKIDIINEIDLELMVYYNLDIDSSSDENYCYYSTSNYQNIILPTMKKLIEEFGYKQLLTSSVL